VGKSAVLGRIVTTADADLAVLVPDDGEVRATVGSVSCAVHAKGKTSMDVATEIARAAYTATPQQPGDVVAGLHEALTERGRERPGTAERNFLVAGLMARMHGQHDQRARSPAPRRWRRCPRTRP
jgi:hypothetical protein